MDVMENAWAQARLASQRFGGTPRDYFKEALTFCWMLKKLPLVWVSKPSGLAKERVLLVPGKGRSKVIVLNARQVLLEGENFILENTYTSRITATKDALLIETTVLGPADNFLHTRTFWLPKSAIVYENYHYLKVKGFVKDAFKQPVYLILG